MQQKRRFVDGFTPRTAVQRLPKQLRRHRIEKLPTATQPDATPPTSKQKKSDFSEKKSIFSLKSIALLVLCAVIGGSAFIYQPAAELTIIIYGIVAIVRRISSKTTFALALIALTCVPIAQVLGRNDLGIAFASYTFLLLVFATVCMARDLSST
jgi:hypothetical protein